jgi:hypothetical protein
MRLIAGIAVLTAAVSSPLAAADIAIRDFRMAIGVSPGPHSTHADFSSGGSATFTSKSSQSLDINAGFAGGEIHDYGVVYGIGLDAARGTFSPSGTGSGSLDYATISPQVRAGLGYALSTSFHIELTPFLGYGLAMVEWPNGTGSETGYGTAFTYGVLASGLARLGQGWRIGVDVGYQGGYTIASVDTAGGSTDLELRTSGVVAHLVAGYEF